MSYKWDNKKPTAQMLGRWQPFHDGHYTLFKEIIKKPLLYLNFCGIACCGDKKEDGKTKIFNFIKNWLNNNEIILISLSLRKTKLRLEVNGKKTFYGMIQEFNIKQISRRTNFYTFEISKKEIQNLS